MTNHPVCPTDGHVTTRQWNNFLLIKHCADIGRNLRIEVLTAFSLRLLASEM
jgi:RNA polymerase subunit RPABC4/transcription elongation factor Spt4